MVSREEKQATIYDREDSEKLFDYSKAVRVKPKIKRVNINLPRNLVTQASDIGDITGTGYQNVLKTAIAIGLHKLNSEIDHNIVTNP
ncbi:MAG: hypothetical protein HRT90_11750 [Candidatus Margulisbacteria bacterium]|nr:hypothetical protein [Candidatus Margulisiibacteriota bacterium]